MAILHRGSVVPLLAAGALVLSSQAAHATSSAAGAAGPAAVARDGFTATALTPDGSVSGLKSTTGRLARSDRALLKRTDTRLVNVLVKLDYDATASYAGTIRGLAATSPRVTGKKLTGDSGAETAYERYTRGIDRRFRAAVADHLKGASLGASLTRVYGGVALRLPAGEAKKLLALPGVAAVQSDTLNQPQTVEAPKFIGAPRIWAQEGGQRLAGSGVILGDLDTGLWPENPMVADVPELGSPPAAPSGNPRQCDFGPNPLTGTPFSCNDKVIGGYNFLTTYNAINSGEVYPDTARDSNGHGTHTTTTAAGDRVAQAPILGIDRGPISGVAPGAWVVAYKVCGLKGCYTSDTVAAVQQAILDGVNVINFSVSGGSSPFSDPGELAFLDAYDAGITVATSAGNSGPGAGTTDHRSPWVITVAASTQERAFQSTLTLRAGSASATFVGSTLTAGISTPAPVVRAQDIPGYEQYCGTPLPAGSATGKIVACARGGTLNGVDIGRVEKGFNVKQGGALGMILYNPSLSDTESDTHFLPTIHLADGTQFLAFLAAHPGATASWPAGDKADAQGDVMAGFSSRGPGGQFLKPDITAPGVQVLAGNTPTPDEVAGGPPGQDFQAIAGTSMAAPHIAGSAILLQALHPDWGPGAIKSALMTSAETDVVKEDLTTPADPFDDGAGRVDLTKAGRVGLVFEDSATQMAALGDDPMTAPSVNTPSVNLPTMPGSISVLRTARNVSGAPYQFDVHTTAPDGASITVIPTDGTIPTGGSKTFRITVSSTGTGQQFGDVRILSDDSPNLHLPVAWFNQQGAVSLKQSCTATTVSVGDTTSCTVTQTNLSLSDSAVSTTSQVTDGLRFTGATGAVVSPGKHKATTGPVILDGGRDAVPAIADGAGPAGGYLPLSLFGVEPNPIGDEQNLNFNTPAYVFGGRTYTRLGVDSNGYVSIGGTTDAADISAHPQHLPDPKQPNGVLAPYWSDLDGSGTGPYGVSVGLLTDGTHHWIVVQWEVHVVGDTSPDGARAFQAWIGDDPGVEDISYAYDGSALQGVPAGLGLTVGAENLSGTAGAQIAGPPTGDLLVTTTPPQPGESLSYSLDVLGVTPGAESLTSQMDSDLVLGRTAVTTPIQVS
jgi:subtilase family protein/fibronectin type III domain protein/PA domain-containing protein